MVSGFFTSPRDHSRIFSGDASEMRMALKESGSLGFSKKLKMSFTVCPLSNFVRCVQGTPNRVSPTRLGRRRPGASLLRFGGGGCRGSVLHQLDVQAERL